MRFADAFSDLTGSGEGALMSDTELWMLIGRRLCAGLIPCYRPSRIQVRLGTREDCDLCGLPVAARDIQYQVDLTPLNDGHLMPSLLAHCDCHEIWTELSRIAVRDQHADPIPLSLP